MITKVVPEKGSRTRGLVEYLWGPGRANEHVQPRVVAAWDATFVRGESEPVMESFERGLLAREMEAPLRMFDKEPGKHVYHVPVSIHADDGALTDEQWAEVAQRAADKLGFTETRDRAAVPWLAMRHGKSGDGNDHIHFVASLYRESGHVPVIRGDWGIWREVREEFAARWNLRTGRERGAGMPGLTQAEIQRAAREGEPETARSELARTVRAVATSARSESDFVHRLRRSGVLVRPRWARGGQSQAQGYSVARRPEEGKKPVWFGATKLADDLRLSQLRERWPEPSEEEAADRLRAWRPHGWRRLPTGRSIQRRKLSAEAWEQAQTKVAEVRTALAHVDPQDRAMWAAVASEGAGVLGVLSRRVDMEHRDELRRASDALARTAQTPTRRGRDARPEAATVLAGVARTASDAMLATSIGPVAMASLLMQVGRLAQAIQQAHEAAGRANEARRSAEAAESMLAVVRATPPETTSGRADDQPNRTQGEERKHTTSERTNDERER